MNTSPASVSPFLLKLRIPIVASINIVVFGIAYYFAFLVRFDMEVPANYWDLLILSITPVVAVKLIAFWAFGSLHGWWRYVTFKDLVGFVPPMALSVAVLAIVNLFLSNSIPRSVLIIDFLVCGSLLVLVRSSWRIANEPFIYKKNHDNFSRALMVSDSHETLMLANQINSQPNSKTQIVGILSENQYSKRTTRAGIPIVGTIDKAGDLAQKHNAKEVWLVAGTVPGKVLCTLKERLNQYEIETRVIPPATDRNQGGGFIPVRDINIDDLLQRETVKLDTRQISEQIQGKVVFVTGAGGSIGSEICRQLLSFTPKKLILVDHRENSVFLIHRELSALPNICTELIPAVGDILDPLRMKAIFESHHPELVYHAAAHKHVGLMEQNPGEAVKNNILGTQRIADIAVNFGVEKFVLVSTDKAVNPTSVMGCTKQIAERYVLSLTNETPTRFVVVRFGNVLGSNGSVVPIFKDQIAKGGPLTITDKRMTRFFMTIPEASRLVLQAAALGNGGEIFVLDMGKQIKIVDLAKKMIQLAGLPESAIEIEFTGARPGEKLYEELYFEEEFTIPTPHKKIFAAKHRKLDHRQVVNEINGLYQLSHAKPDDVRKQLKLIVPEYQSKCQREDTGRQLVPEAHQSSPTSETGSGIPRV